MEPLKHECGIVMIRLRRPLEYYKRNTARMPMALESFI